MEFMGLNEIREKYLTFFESKEHLRLKSFPLVPVNDNSLLLINSGMAPLKPYFTGDKKPPSKRVTTCQKCIRTPDIERVGKTARHGTFFEMLGNFSFGDYFKDEVIPWAWEFCTKEMNLPVDKLHVTVYLDDDETYDIWHDKVGIPKEKITRLGKADNFWEIGMGPCGPCSEIYFDRGAENGCGDENCAPGCDCDRFVEFWNLVFTQFDSDGLGNYARLEHPNIDTGMGLERLACIVQNVDNLFEVDTIQRVIKHIEEISNVKYKVDAQRDVSIRIITDHVRSVTFLVCDGVLPSNEGRGYVLRKLLRRAARHGKLLKIEDAFLADLCDTVINESKDAYPELLEKKDFIKKVIKMEEDRFIETIDQGIAMLDELILNMQNQHDVKNKMIFSGDEAFKLYDTYGFPLDLTNEILSEKGILVDEVRFNDLMEQQRKKARAARSSLGDVGWSENQMADIGNESKFRFVGYDSFAVESTIDLLLKDGVKVDAVSTEDNDVVVILNTTPFYAEGGGQVGDVGYITGPNGILKVKNTKKAHNGVHIHICSVSEGTIFQNDVVRAIVDKEIRLCTMRNHSATHLLQKALKEVLGNHITQSGSYVDSSRLRFDFSHYSSLTPEELCEVEKKVNNMVLEGLNISFQYTNIEDAKKLGATADFGEKYGEIVRVVNMGDYTLDLCGGTHLDNTAKVGLFKIISEASVAAGVRRIEAVTGSNVLKLLDQKEELIIQTSNVLKTTPTDIARKATQINGEIKDMQKKIDKLNSKIASFELGDLFEGAKQIGSVKLITKKFEDTSTDELRNIADMIKEKSPDYVAVLASIAEDKINFVTVCGADAIKNGANAGKLIKDVAKVTGGGGGGRPDSATAGGKDIQKLEQAFSAAEGILAAMLK